MLAICTATYNQSSYIYDCMLSIANQDFKDYFWIIVDDCSTDGTQQIIDEFIKNRGSTLKVKFIKNDQNLGPARNAELWIDRLKDLDVKFVAFVNGDDKVSSNRFSIQIPIMLMKPEISLLCGGTYNINKLGEIIGAHDYSRFPKRVYFPDVIPFGPQNPNCSTLIRLPTGKDERALILSQRIDFGRTVYLLSLGGSLVFHEDMVAFYRVNAGVTSHPRLRLQYNILEHLNLCNQLLCDFPGFAKQILRRYENCLAKLGLRFVIGEAPSKSVLPVRS